MKQYLLSMYQPQGQIPPPEVLGPVMEKLGVIRQELMDQGAWVFGQGLHAPETATVLRPQGDDVIVTDGPFVEGKEVVSGYTEIEVADLDEALRMVKTWPGCPIVEIRPLES